ncbi:MAG: elongation factor P [Candidatus Sumerlaeia bacterium]|nr:elongation factor P [Candidatus Sumerlaeia bacterium]
MAQVDPNSLRAGMKVVIEGTLYQVTEYELRTPGNLRSFVRTKMKSLLDGRVVEMTFRGGKFDIQEADYETKTCNFLYSDQDGYHFMELTSYEQFTVSGEFLGIQANFLVPDTEVIVAFWENRPVSLLLPPKIAFKVVDTIDEVTKGNSANQILKEATIETGYKLQVPGFIKIGDSVRISTDDGMYVDRA